MTDPRESCGWGGAWCGLPITREDQDRFGNSLSESPQNQLLIITHSAQCVAVMRGRWCVGVTDRAGTKVIFNGADNGQFVHGPARRGPIAMVRAK